MAQFMTGRTRRPIPGQAIPVTGPGISNASNEAFGRMGQVIEGAALDQIHTERVQLEQQQRERQQLFEAAEKQRELIEMDKATDQLRDAHDEIGNQMRSGTLPMDQAEKVYQERATKVMGEAVAGLRPQTQDLARRHLERTGATLGNSMRKLVDGQARQDITAGMQTQLETLQRQYATDPQGSTALAMQLIETQGPLSTLAPEQRAKLAQSWKEQTQFTSAFEAISAGRTDRKALTAAEQLIGTLPDLDPQRRAQLMDRAQAYRAAIDQKELQRAQHAQIEADRRLKQAEASFNTFQTLADKGGMLDPAYIDRVTRDTAGTPYQAGVVALAQLAKDNGGLAAQPIAAQQQALDAINSEIARNGRSPALDKRKDQVEKILSGSQGDLRTDPMRAGLERGIITNLPPLNFGGGIPGVIEQVQARMPGAQRVAVWAGRPVSPLTADEADTLGTQLAALPPKDRAGMVVALQGVMGAQAAQGLARQIDKTDKALALAFGYGNTTTTQNRYTSELILRGQQAQKDGTSTKGDKEPEVKAARWKATLAADLRDAFPSQAQADAVLQAAEFIAHGIASEQQGKLSQADMARAVNLAAGGPVLEHNGRKVAMPAGVDDSALERRMRSVSAQELGAQAPGGTVLAGGVPMALADFVDTLPGQQLIYAGPNRYAVLVGGRPVKNSRGDTITIQVR